VTNAQFEQFQKHQRPKYQHGKTANDQPAEPVTWRDAQSFAVVIDQRTSVVPFAHGSGMEYACRAGTQTRLYGAISFGIGTKPISAA